MQPKQEYGYVIIDTEEKRKVFEPQQPTDEFWYRALESWSPCAVKSFKAGNIYRRKIQPGDGFEIVPADEMESREMAYTIDGIQWKSNLVVISQPVGNYKSLLAFRRPIKHPATPPVASTWRPIGDLTGLPESGFVRLGGHNGSGEPFDYKEDVSIVRNNTLLDVTHWSLIAPVPKPPKPMTEEEALKAALDDAPTIAGRISVHHGWLAHIEFLKKGGVK